MKVLTTTMCYPSPTRPDQGIFVQRRAMALSRLGYEIEVVSPQPWCPLLRPDAGCSDQASPLPVSYPRMFSIPVVGWATDGFTYARALKRSVADRGRSGRFDLVDAHFEYPDGVGAWLASRRLGIPAIVTVRGKIVSLSRHRGRRAQIQAMLRRVDGIIAVSRSLAEQVHTIAGEGLHVDVIPNGIDTATFRPLDRIDCRRRLNWDPRARYVLAVGHLQRLKGFDRLVAVWPALRAVCGDVRLVLAGSRRGERRFAARLFEHIDRVNQTAGPCIEFLGPQSPEHLNLLYNAVDVTANTSRSEGWCNAIAESLAVGTPVVATDVGGNREQIHSPELGVMVPDEDGDALTAALTRALRSNWDRSAIAAVGSRRSWDQVAREVDAVFQRVLAEHRATAGDRPGRRASDNPTSIAEMTG